MDQLLRDGQHWKSKLVDAVKTQSFVEGMLCRVPISDANHKGLLMTIFLISMPTPLYVRHDYFIVWLISIPHFDIFIDLGSRFSFCSNAGGARWCESFARILRSHAGTQKPYK